MVDFYRDHPLTRASLSIFLCSHSAVQRFGLSGFLAYFFVVFSSEEEERLFRHLCSMCYMSDGLALVMFASHAEPRRPRR